MQSTASVPLRRGEAQFEFQIPDQLGSRRIEELVLFIGSDGGWSNAPATAIFDWEREAWAQLEDPVIGRNIVAEVKGLVAPEGLVRVQLSANGNQGGCVYLDLGFTAR